MRFDELFQESARLQEPPLPGDVVGGVHRAQARRRRLQALVASPLVVLAVVTAVALIPGGGGKHISPPLTSASPTTESAMPALLEGIKNGRLVGVRTSTGHTGDEGPATAFAGSWIARPAGSCRSHIVEVSSSHTFDVTGAVGAMAVSPDHRTLAYARSAAAGDPGTPEYPCGMDALVLRDVATGSERVWTGDDGVISALSWSPDSTHLAFQAVSCCDASTEIKDLEVSRPPGPVSAVTSVQPEGETLFHDPVWSGDTLLVLRDIIDTTGNGADSYDVVDLAGTVVATLPAQGVSLDVHDGWLLVALYGSPETPGSLIALRAGRQTQPITLGTGYDQAHWS